MTNRHFCRPTNDGTGLIYAPVVLPPNPRQPTESEYNAAGWYRCAFDPPAPPEGKTVASTRYEIADGKCVAVYTYSDVPAAPRTFSKLKLYVALVQTGLWDALKGWLETQDYDGINAYTAFSLAQELTDAHPMFSRWYAAAKSILGVDDATAEAILAASVVEDA